MASVDFIQARINSRLSQALNQITVVTDRSVGEFTADAAKMAKALLRDEINKKGTGLSTGKLEASIKAVRFGELNYAVRTDASDPSGTGYGAKQEYGWHPRGGKKKVKGRKYIIRGTFGIVKRWRRGERWRD